MILWTSLFPSLAFFLRTRTKTKKIYFSLLPSPSTINLLLTPITLLSARYGEIVITSHHSQRDSRPNLQLYSSFIFITHIPDFAKSTGRRKNKMFSPKSQFPAKYYSNSLINYSCLCAESSIYIICHKFDLWSPCK